MRYGEGTWGSAEPTARCPLSPEDARCLLKERDHPERNLPLRYHLQSSPIPCAVDGEVTAVEREHDFASLPLGQVDERRIRDLRLTVVETSYKCIEPLRKLFLERNDLQPFALNDSGE